MLNIPDYMKAIKVAISAVTINMVSALGLRIKAAHVASGGATRAVWEAGYP